MSFKCPRCGRVFKSTQARGGHRFYCLGGKAHRVGHHPAAGRILQLRREGKTYRAVARELGVSMASIRAVTRTQLAVKPAAQLRGDLLQAAQTLLRALQALGV